MKRRISGHLSPQATRSARTGVAAVLVGSLALLAAPTQALAAPAPTPAAPATTTALGSDSASQQVQAAMDAMVAAGASGVTVRLDDGRRTYRLASGKSRLDPPQKMRPEAKLRVASITKSFVSTVTLQLVGERRLSLDDTVERWQPGLIPGGDQITVRQLLNHTSGIFNFTEDKPFLERFFTDPEQVLTPQQLIAVATAHPALFPPGSDWSYSNTNYVVLGLILERVTHRSAAQLIEQRIIRPLGLRHTLFPEASPQIPGYYAHGYIPPSLSGDGYLDITRVSPSWLWTAGALVSNIDDLRTFYRALLGGRLLKPAQLAQMKTLRPVAEGFDYGLGLYRTATACGQMWGHDGSVPGYQTVAWNDETGRRGFVIGVPVTPDPQINEAFARLITVSACRALGQEPPPAASLRTADTGLRLVDRTPVPSRFR